MKNIPKHVQANLYPSEVVTLALLFSLKGRGNRAFYRWVSEKMLVFSDTGFAKNGWYPSNLKVCPRGTWNDRMMIESVLSMLTRVCHFKKVGHRVWSYFKSRVGWTMALFNILVQWNGIEPDDTGFVHPSIANFSL